MKTHNNIFRLVVTLIILVILIYAVTRVKKSVPVIQPVEVKTEKPINMEKPCYSEGVEVECKG